MKAPPFFPPPPPMFALPGAQHPSSLTDFLVDPSTGKSFHPDFMFCGLCADCKEETNTDINTDTNTDTNTDINTETKTETKTRTNTETKDSSLDSNPVQPADGGMDHSSDSDSLSLTKPANHPLDSAPHPAFPETTFFASATASATANHNRNHNRNRNRNRNRNHNAFPNGTTSFSAPTSAAPVRKAFFLVKSSFQAQGICCASEIPVIRRILKPLEGVDTVNLNLTTKVVHVQHDYHTIDASRLAQTLTDQGFPARTLRDGGAAAELNAVNKQSIADDGSDSDSDSDDDGNNDKQSKSKNKSKNKSKSKSKSTDTAVAKLLDKIGRSSYVESTLEMEGLRPNQVHALEKAVADSFFRFQVRAVYPSASSETVKVEHNPDLVSIEEIRKVLAEYSTNKWKWSGGESFPSNAEVYIDGAEANLFLPSEDDYPSSSNNNNNNSNHHNNGNNGGRWSIFRRKSDTGELESSVAAAAAAAVSASDAHAVEQKTISALESTISQLRSEMVQQSTAHKEEAYIIKKKIANLEAENEALILKNATLEEISRFQEYR